MEINKHSSARRQRGGNKRALNREHSENHYEGSDEPAESRSSSFPPSPRRSARRALSLIQNKDWCCVTYYWWCPRLGLPFPLPGLQRAWKDKKTFWTFLIGSHGNIHSGAYTDVLLLLLLLSYYSLCSKDEHVWGICFKKGKTGNHLACLVGVLLQSTDSHIANTREDPRSLTAILAPAAARNQNAIIRVLFTCRSWFPRQQRGMAINPGIKFKNMKKKKTHFAANFISEIAVCDLWKEEITLSLLHKPVTHF